jgi:hypothetical protein
MNVRGIAVAIAAATSAMTGCPEVEPEWPNSTASGAKACAAKRISTGAIGPNSASISLTS